MKGRSGSVARYGAMSIDELKRMPVEEYASDNAIGCALERRIKVVVKTSEYPCITYKYF